MNFNKRHYDDGLKEYTKSIDKYKPLPMEKERQLGSRIQKGDNEALNTLINHNLKFVVSTARKYSNTGIPIMELISEGNQGLMHAATKYDGERRVKFITYAVWWVKYYINEYIKKQYTSQDVRLDDCGMDDDRPKLERFTYEGVNEEFEEKFATLQSQGAAVEELLQCLHEREIKVLMMFYGLNDGNEMTLEEVGKEMHLTMERVRQIKDGALNKLRCSVLAMDSDVFRSFKELI